MRFVVPEGLHDDDCHGSVPAMWTQRDRGELVYMDPEEFLEQADPSFDEATASAGSLAFLRDAVDAGDCFAALELWPGRKRPWGLKHEGRHRALIAIEEGLREVPVFLWD